MPGGRIKIEFDDKGHAHMTGSVTYVFCGEYELPDVITLRYWNAKAKLILRSLAFAFVF